MSFDAIDQLLEKFELKKTDIRRRILQIFFNQSDSLTQADLIQKMSKNSQAPDRISLYRNLNQMKEVGLIHEVDVNQYVACTHDCSSHPHILLFCKNCHRYSEIVDHKQVNQLMKSIAQFQFFNLQSSVSLKGTCLKCQDA